MFVTTSFHKKYASEILKNVALKNFDLSKVVINANQAFRTALEPSNVKTIRDQSSPQLPTAMKILPDQEMQEFRSFFPHFVEDLTSNNLITDLPVMNRKLKKILNYNVPTGKHIRAAILIAVYKSIMQENNIRSGNIREDFILAWCMEMMGTYILIMDDIVDNSETRRGKLSWFKFKDVGLNAINDATIIQMSLFEIINKYFSEHKYYKELVNVFLKVNLKTFIGQTLDCERLDLEKISKQRFNEVTDNKTGYYTFYFPMVLAMYLANRPDLDFHRSGLKILWELGRFYQFQNDYMDCYGESYSGKLGTDIQEGKCSWLILNALERASLSQTKVLKENYGRWDKGCVEKVKEVYEELKLRDSYEAELTDRYTKMNTYLVYIKNELTRDLLKQLIRVCFGYQTYLTFQ
ncbi:hypothetical protein HHI36_011407 [Cryptolaemus montrouzieri]|uniref:Farnesyl pyrophosphate synthase n=1 Tax=Cryptolaemus montrouzieri TaxID=559131 RepID=A0ABD2MLP2_9CUCU